MSQIALSKDFLEAYAAIPRAQQKKVRAFVEKFRNDPGAGAIHYEPLYETKDDKIRTVRIGDDYRAVVIHPPKGDVYLLAWVDHHDEAMAWAKQKVFEVHPQTGTLQIWDVRAEGAVAEGPLEITPRAPLPIPESRLLAGHTDEALVILGVPEALLPAARALRTDRDLDDLARWLPREAADALYFLAAGYSVEQTIDELDRKPQVEATAPSIDISNFAAALERPSSQDQFKLVEGGDELADILDAPLEKWRIFLHPSQSGLVRVQSNGPVRVLGGAGTGKTVVAMHRVRFLAREIFNDPKDRILFTTYNTNLAGDIRHHLKLLCGAELDRIEVTSLDAWARRFLNSRGAKVTIPKSASLDGLWKRILAQHDLGNLSESFLRDEWRAMIQARGITREADYLVARRVGRGTRLSRPERRSAWAVFASVREALEEKGWLEYDDVIREARLTLAKNPGAVRYRAVVADEIQDFSEEQLRLLRHLVPEGSNDLFLVGDAHQRIYGRAATLAGAGIQIRGRRSRRLNINYRTTARIREFAEQALFGIEVDDLDEGNDTIKGTRSLRPGEPPEVRWALGSEGEAELIVTRLREWLATNVEPSAICLVARTHELLNDRYAALLRNADIPFEKLPGETGGDSPDAKDGGTAGAAGSPGKIALATMHRVKGLEFARVVLAGVQEGTVPLRLPVGTWPDPAAEELHEQQEMKLLYVAATRARDRLVVTGYGDAPAWVSARS